MIGGCVPLLIGAGSSAGVGAGVFYKTIFKGYMAKKDLAQIILYDNNHRIFLQQRDDWAQVNPNTIGLFGGAIEKKETPKCAVQRECLEEIGYKLYNPRLLDKRKYSFNENNGTRYVYIEKYDGLSPLTCNEGTGIWLERDSIKKNEKILQIDKKVLEFFFHRLRIIDSYKFCPFFL